ncbi:MAG: hypothetical protein U1E65_08460 [Myxococcota bacterium]
MGKCARGLWFGLLLCLGCVKNALPPLGDCPSPGAASPPTTEPVPLVEGAAGCEDLRFSPAINKLVAEPQGTGTVFLLSSEGGTPDRVDGVPPGVSTGDAGDGMVFVGDRAGDKVLALEPGLGTIASTLPLEHTLEYVRYTALTHEVWVTEPQDRQIEILSVKDGALSHAAFISVPGGPIGLAFDNTRRRAYVHGAASIIAIDVDRRQILAEWRTGCGRSEGVPVVDEDRGFIFAGCSTRGGGAVLSVQDGTVLSGYESGGGAAVLAYSPSYGHLYLRGDPGPTVEVLAVCGNGAMAPLGRVEVADVGHGMAADNKGNVWVCDEAEGGLIHFRDPWAKVSR